jgi:antitoxin VapB
MNNVMALNIRNQEAEQLAETLATLTKQTKTQAVTEALRDRLARLQRQRRKRSLADALDEIALHCSSLPVLDKRSGEEMLYDERGLPV